MSIPLKEFVLTHVVEDIQKITGSLHQGKIEYHFGVPWKISFFRNFDNLYLCLTFCESGDGRSIDTEFELKIISPRSDSMSVGLVRCFNRRPHSFGLNDFVSFEKLQKYYTVNGKLTLQANVKILKMTGFGKDNLMNFHENDLSDVVLVVQDKRFYVLKKFLARQSTYFNALLLGNFDESKQSEVVLRDIDPADFQNFLELIHGESSIDDTTIDGILHLAEMYDAPTAIRRCEEFLTKESKKSRQQKLEISVQYQLEKLKEKCLSEIRTVNDIRSVVNANLDDMDGSIAKALLQKSLSLH